MIINIFGGPGTGKTSLMTHFAVEAMTNPDIRRNDIRECTKLVKKLNKGNACYTVPDRHLVYADYHIMAKKSPQITSWAIEGHKVGLPNEEQETHFFPPFARIFIDEAQRKLNSRKGGIQEDYINYFYEIHRHNRLNIMLACQRQKLIDLNVRELADKIIEVIKMQHRYDRFGCIQQTTWHCIEFDNCFAIDQYLANGKDPKYGKAVKFTHQGDIFKHYDSFGCMAKFYHNNYNKDFDRIQSQKVQLTIDSMRHYNDTHPLGKK